MRIILLILSSLVITAGAQEKAARTCRILFLMRPPDAPKTLQLFDGSTSQPVELPRMNFSMVYQIAPGALTLRLLPEAPAKPEDIPRAAPSVTVAENISDFYLLVASDPTNPVAPVRMSVVDAGRSLFKDGQMLWFNVSDKSVGGQVGKQRLAIAPNGRTLMEAPADAKGEYAVDLAYRTADDSKLHPICETKWRHDPSSRTVMFVTNEPGTRTPRVMGFPDRREAKKEP